MKMLIYGIDGGDLEIMKMFDMPFLHRFLEKNINIELTEDLFNRGWVEILTGKEGKDTRGFYMAPVLDGSHQCATNFSMKQLENDTDIIPLWKLAEQKGVRYCIMNVPTTTPVPKTHNGILIGSAGGGLNRIEGIPKLMVSDDKIRRFLEGKNYIVDIRIPNQDIEKTEQLFQHLKKMEDIRTDCFIEICQNEDIEFGFLVNRGTTIVQYLARSEIDTYAALREKNESTPKLGDKNWIHEYLKEHYQTLDNNIRRLYEELKPDHFIITADHNTVPHKYRASVTPFLLRKGFLQKKKGGKSYFIPRAKTVLKKMGLGSKVRAFSKKLTPSMQDALREYDWTNSVAFGSSYISGIYINDQKRFNGPIHDKDINNITNKICSAFNALDENERKGIIAKPYRAHHITGKYSDALPDIILTGSEGIFFYDYGEYFLWKNPTFGPIPKDLSQVLYSAFTGDKGCHPICLMDNQTSTYINDDDSRILTIVYHLVDRIL